DSTIPHHHQREELRCIKVEIEEEEKMIVSGEQQSMENVYPPYSQDFTQEDPSISKDEELKDIKVEVKEEEEETMVSGDQQSMEEGEMIMKSEQEESSLYIETSK
ncbi:hypothetical protein AB205_0097700, partial [Aquarana catesbeiana]